MTMFEHQFKQWVNSEEYNALVVHRRGERAAFLDYCARWFRTDTKTFTKAPPIVCTKAALPTSMKKKDGVIGSPTAASSPSSSSSPSNSSLTTPTINNNNDGAAAAVVAVSTSTDSTVTVTVTTSTSDSSSMETSNETDRPTFYYMDPPLWGEAKKAFNERARQRAERIARGETVDPVMEAKIEAEWSALACKRHHYGGPAAAGGRMGGGRMGGGSSKTGDDDDAPRMMSSVSDPSELKKNRKSSGDGDSDDDNASNNSDDSDDSEGGYDSDDGGAQSDGDGSGSEYERVRIERRRQQMISRAIEDDDADSWSDDTRARILRERKKQDTAAAKRGERITIVINWRPVTVARPIVKERCKTCKPKLNTNTITRKDKKEMDTSEDKASTTTPSSQPSTESMIAASETTKVTALGTMRTLQFGGETRRCRAIQSILNGDYGPSFPSLSSSSSSSSSTTTTASSSSQPKRKRGRPRKDVINNNNNTNASLTTGAGAGSDTSKKKRKRRAIDDDEEDDPTVRPPSLSTAITADVPIEPRAPRYPRATPISKGSRRKASTISIESWRSKVMKLRYPRMYRAQSRQSQHQTEQRTWFDHNRQQMELYQLQQQIIATPAQVVPASTYGGYQGIASASPAVSQARTNTLVIDDAFLSESSRIGSGVWKGAGTKNIATINGSTSSSSSTTSSLLSYLPSPSPPSSSSSMPPHDIFLAFSSSCPQVATAGPIAVTPSGVYPYDLHNWHHVYPERRSLYGGDNMINAPPPSCPMVAVAAPMGIRLPELPVTRPMVDTTFTVAQASRTVKDAALQRPLGDVFLYNNTNEPSSSHLNGHANGSSNTTSSTVSSSPPSSTSTSSDHNNNTASASLSHKRRATDTLSSPNSSSSSSSSSSNVTSSTTNEHSSSPRGEEKTPPSSAPPNHHTNGNGTTESDAQLHEQWLQRKRAHVTSTSSTVPVVEPQVG
jgi:hypothetical protein